MKILRYVVRRMSPGCQPRDRNLIVLRLYSLLTFCVQAMGSLKVDQLAHDASKMVLGEDSDSLATSLNTTPTGSPAQVSIAA